MTYKILNRLNRVSARMKENNSESVTLQREGSPNTVGVTASLGRSDIEEGYEGVPVTQVTTECFYFDTVDYVFDGDPVQPLHGDKIVRENSQVYAVVSGPDGESCFDWVLSNQSRMKVYTSRIQ